MSSPKLPVDIKRLLSTALERPRPMPHQGSLRSDEDVARHRRLYCSSYRRCLDESIRAGWDGFTCMHCPLQAAAGDGPGSVPFAQDRREST